MTTMVEKNETPFQNKNTHLILDEIAEECLKLCKFKGWSRDWQGGAIYMPLEVAEFIEALRGKGDETPASEAGDVLFVLLSVLSHYNISLGEVLVALEKKMGEVRRGEK